MPRVLPIICLFLSIASAELVCVTGGDGNLVDSTECLHPLTRQWVLYPALTIASGYEKAAFNFGGVACLVGPANNSYAGVWCTNGSSLSDPWVQLPPFITVRQGMTPIYGDGWVGVVGSNRANSTQWEYSTTTNFGVATDPSSLSFSWGPALTDFRSVRGPAAITLNGSICVVGGESSFDQISDGSCSCLTSSLNNSIFTVQIPWLSGPSLVEPRSYATPLALPDGRWCLSGGQRKPSSSTPLDTTECIGSAASTQFAVVPSLTLPSPRWGAANISLNGLPCMAGGATAVGLLSDVICVNSTLGGWIDMSSLTIGRYKASSFTLPFASFAPPSPTPPTELPLLPGRYDCVTGGFNGT